MSSICVKCFKNGLAITAINFRTPAPGLEYRLDLEQGLGLERVENAFRRGRQSIQKLFLAGCIMSIHSFQLLEEVKIKFLPTTACF